MTDCLYFIAAGEPRQAVGEEIGAQGMPVGIFPARGRNQGMKSGIFEGEKREKI
jgi:hypothetical protein